MDRSDIEERNAKCNLCADELSIAENILYGNRCCLCAAHEVKTSFVVLAKELYYDWRIYKITMRLKRKIGAEDARMAILGSLGVVGVIDKRGLTTKNKGRFVKELRGFLK